MKKIDITNQKFGRLLAIERIGNGDRPSKTSLWRFKCDCGGEKLLPYTQVVHNNTRSCGCLRRESGCPCKLPLGIAARNGLYSRYKSAAKERKLQFKLTIEEFTILTSTNCHYCDKKPSQMVKGKTSNGPYIHNGIDRKDNNIGYLIDNCVPCCKTCNFAKHTQTLDEFLK